MDRLGLYGTIHYDRRSKVETELSGFVDATNPDAVFTEQPTERPGRRTIAVAAVRTPLVLLGIVVLQLLRAPFYLAFNRRFDSTEHVAIERLPDDLPVHPVDRSLLFFMAESRLLTTVLSWLLLAAFLVAAPIQTGVAIVVLGLAGVVLGVVRRRNRRLAAGVGTAMFALALGVVGWIDPYAVIGLVVLTVLPTTVAAGTLVDPGRVTRVVVRFGLAAVLVWVALSADLVVEWFVVVAYGAVGLFVSRTLDTRNERMIERATAIADEKGYETGTIVVGLAHVSGLGELAAERGITVTRTYTPRWLRAPGTTDEDPMFESGETQDSVARDHPIQPGSTGRRTLASLVDLLLVVGVTVAIGIGLDTVGVTTNGTILGAIGVVAGMAYYFVLETAFGRTLGKRLTNLVVTDEDGYEPSRRAYLLRNLVRPVDFVVFYLVGFATMGLTRRRQRLGDLVANTEVRKAD